MSTVSTPINPRALALQALQVKQPTGKVDALRTLWQYAQTFEWTEATSNAALEADESLPGRPDKPILVHPGNVPTRSVHTLAGRAALVHAICHIEFNAINLALDAVWRYAGMPTAFYMDWLRVAYEESTHFDMLSKHLNSLQPNEPWSYGDFNAHDGLWLMCEKTAVNITARMALVPRTLEARVRCHAADTSQAAHCQHTRRVANGGDIGLYIERRNRPCSHWQPLVQAPVHATGPWTSGALR